MTDLSNNGSGAKADDATAAEHKGDRKTSTEKKAPMADETKTTTASTASSASAADESRLRATLQQIEARAEELRRWGMARQEMAREVVEERPLVVVGAAFGVGLLLGLIASRV